MKQRLLSTLLALCLAGVFSVAYAVRVGDVNADRAINVTDVNLVVSEILNGGSNPVYDLNRDGKVNVTDVNLLVSLILNPQPERLAGGDVSMLLRYEQRGALYYDQNGQRVTNMLKHMHDNGWNALRVRLFVDPANATDAAKKEGVIQDLAYVKQLGKRIKDAGFMFVLDFHYSDTWADPGQQNVPKRWQGLDAVTMADSVYSYTRYCLTELTSAGAKPDLVQIGNEVTYGMLWPDSRCWPSGDDYNSGTWANFARCLNAGSRAVREVCPLARVIVHVEMSRYTNPIQFFETIDNNNVDFDVLGLSFYPAYHASTGTIFGALNTVLSSLNVKAKNKNREVMIMETGYGYKWAMNGTKYDFTSQYPYSGDGQASYLTDLIADLKRYTTVTGLFWWWPEANEYGINWQNQVTSSWWNASMVNNENGRIQPAFYKMKDFAAVETDVNVD